MNYRQRYLKTRNCTIRGMLIHRIHHRQGQTHPYNQGAIELCGQLTFKRFLKKTTRYCCSLEIIQKAVLKDKKMRRSIEWLNRVSSKESPGYGTFNLIYPPTPHKWQIHPHRPHLRINPSWPGRKPRWHRFRPQWIHWPGKGSGIDGRRR